MKSFFASVFVFSFLLLFSACSHNNGTSGAEGEAIPPAPLNPAGGVQKVSEVFTPSTLFQMADVSGNVYLVHNGNILTPEWEEGDESEAHEPPSGGNENVCGGRTTISCTEYNWTETCPDDSNKVRECKQWYCKCLGDGDSLTPEQSPRCGSCYTSRGGEGGGFTGVGETETAN